MESFEQKIANVLTEARRAGFNAVVDAVEKADLPENVRRVVTRIALDSIEHDARNIQQVVQWTQRDKVENFRGAETMASPSYTPPSSPRRY